jgi:hypothetical protein
MSYNMATNVWPKTLYDLAVFEKEILLRYKRVQQTPSERGYDAVSTDYTVYSRWEITLLRMVFRKMCEEAFGGRIWDAGVSDICIYEC